MNILISSFDNKICMSMFRTFEQMGQEQVLKTIKDQTISLYTDYKPI